MQQSIKRQGLIENLSNPNLINTSMPQDIKKHSDGSLTNYF